MIHWALYICISNVLTAEDEFCNCDGVFVNGFVEMDCTVISRDLSIPLAGDTLSLVARAAHSASNGSSKTVAISLFHRPLGLISNVTGSAKNYNIVRLKFYLRK